MSAAGDHFTEQLREIFAGRTIRRVAVTDTTVNSKYEPAIDTIELELSDGCVYEIYADGGYDLFWLEVVRVDPPVIEGTCTVIPHERHQLGRAA